MGVGVTMAVSFGAALRVEALEVDRNLGDGRVEHAQRLLQQLLAGLIALLLFLVHTRRDAVFQLLERLRDARWQAGQPVAR